MTELYLVRHAQATGNLERRFQGVHDTDITDLGKRQIAYLSGRFADIHLDAVYTSPLTRAAKTASGIAGPQGLIPIVRDGLIEIDGGAFENRPFAELEAEYAELFSLFLMEPQKFPGVGGGESIAQVYGRVVTAVDEIVRENEGKTIAAVSHGAAIRCYLSFALGLGLDRMNEVPWGGNTCVSHILFADEAPQVLFCGDDSHLPEDCRVHKYQAGK